MKKIISYMYLMVGMCALSSCADVLNEWWKPASDNIAPGKVTNVKVEPLNGGVRLIYDLPADDDLMGVKAVYTVNEANKDLEVIASAYTDTITIEGFGDTEQHSVMLYAVDKSGNVSEGEEAYFSPLTPAINTIRETLSATESFGGVYVSWLNPMRKDIAVTLSVKDSLGNWQLWDTHFTNAEVDKCNFKGLKQEELQDFRIEIRDRWLNYAAPLDVRLSPKREDWIRGKVDGMVIWKFVDDWKYRGDLAFDLSMSMTAPIITMTDGAYGGYPNINAYTSHFFAEQVQSGLYVRMPIYMTFDLARKAFYSGMKITMGNRSPLGSAGVPSKFEVWGGNYVKTPSEIGNGDQIENLRYWTSWDFQTINGLPLYINGTDEWKKDGTWFKLAECVYMLPSGINTVSGWPASTLSADDQLFIQNGLNYEFDPAMADKSFRYIRLDIKESSQGRAQFMMAEIEFLGVLDNN
jgi:hypothetical protein